MQFASVMTALTAACALLISGLSLKVTRDGQSANRFANAVELLGNQKNETRIGAIYALAQLAVDSEDDLPLVTKILTDFVKVQAFQDEGSDEYLQSCRSGRATPPPVGVALRVLFTDLAKERRKHRTGRDQRINLERVCLTHVDLSGADLSYVNLNNAIIYGSRFPHATFTDACLENANLVGNSFRAAGFVGADARGAVFGDETSAISATMTEVDFRDADLSYARLYDLTLNGADFLRSRLDAADLGKSNLAGARLRTDLTRAEGLSPGVARNAGAPVVSAARARELCSD